tara:strand:- start:1158 stop:1535 length:378 start_codon:yes stop_codon:yes gene_type:complete
MSLEPEYKSHRGLFQEVSSILGIDETSAHWTDEDFIDACQYDGRQPVFRMKQFDAWYKRLERWMKIASYFKRQSLYTYATENGHGGIASAAKVLGVTRQRAHDMYKEAESERLSQFTPKFYCEDV